MSGRGGAGGIQSDKTVATDATNAGDGNGLLYFRRLGATTTAARATIVVVDIGARGAIRRRHSRAAVRIDGAISSECGRVRTRL